MPLSFIVLLITPILGSLPNADINDVEGNNKYVIMSKTGKMNYYLSKHVSIFIVGFLNVLFCIELLYIMELIAVDVFGNVYLTDGSLLLDFLMPDTEGQYFNSIIIEQSILFTQVSFLLIAVFGGLCGNLSYTINQVIAIPGITYLGSFVTLFGLSFVLQYLPYIGEDIPYYNLLHFNLLYSRVSENNMFIIAIYITWLVFICMLTAVFQAKAIIEER